MSADATAAPLPDDAGLDQAQHASAPAASELWSRIDQWLESASDYLNPILVKETRQALKSRQFVLWFLLLLAACWAITILGIAMLGPGVLYSASGGVMFLAYFFVLAFALIVVVPFAAFRSLAAEQEDNTRDVLMVSALTPLQVINGKLGSAGLQIVVYLSALSPCLAFTYLLRGIDLLTILYLPALAVAVSILLSMLGLLLASASKKRYSQVLTSVGLVSMLIGAFLLCSTFALAAIQDYVLDFRDAGFWAATAMIFNLGLCAFLLAYFGAAGMNSFSSSNRSTALRRVLFFTQACFIGWMASVWLTTNNEEEVLVVAGAIGGVFWYFAGALLTGEGAVLSERVRRTLPESTMGRVLGTWFNPGPGTGYLFVVANLTTMLLLLLWALPRSGVKVDGVEGDFLVLGFAYLVAFLGFGRLLISALRAVAPITLLGCFLIHVLFLLACVSLPELLRATVNSYSRQPFGWYDATNPMRTLAAVLDGEPSDLDMTLLLIVIPGVALCAFLVNLVLAAREIRQTRSPLPRRVIEDEAELHPVTAVVANPWGDVRTAE